MDTRDALERFASPLPGVVTSAARLRLDLLASFKSLDGEGALPPDLLDAVCQQAQRSRDRISNRNAQNDVEEQGLSVFPDLVAPRLNPQELARWRAAIDPPASLVPNAGRASSSGTTNWREAARSRQEKHDQLLERATSILSRHGKIASLDEVRWGRVNWTSTPEFATTILRGARFAARVGTDGSPRPGPPLSEADVLRRFHDLIELASTNWTYWGSTALKQACVELEKKDDAAASEASRLSAFPRPFQLADCPDCSPSDQWLKESEKRTPRSTAFQGSYAHATAPTKQAAIKPVAKANSKFARAEPTDAAALEKSAVPAPQQSIGSSAAGFDGDEGGVQRKQRLEDDDSTVLAKPSPRAAGEPSVGTASADADLTATTQTVSPAPAWKDKGKWRADQSQGTSSSAAAVWRSLPSKFIPPEFDIDVSDRLATSDPARAGSGWTPRLSLPSARFSIADLALPTRDPEIEETRDARRRKTGLRSLGEERQILAELPVETHAELFLAAHEHCAGVAYSLTNIIRVLLADHLCLIEAFQRHQELSDESENTSSQHKPEHEYPNEASDSEQAPVALARVPLAPLDQNALAPVRKRSFSLATDAVSREAASIFPTAPKRQRSSTSLGHSPSAADIAPDHDAALVPVTGRCSNNHSPASGTASPQKPSRAVRPPSPPSLFFDWGSTAPADISLCVTLLAQLILQTSIVSTCSDIEDQALDEGVAAAAIANGSVELDSIIHEYLDDDASHEAVGMERSGTLDAVDKPLVPVLIEMIRRGLHTFREMVQVDRTLTSDPDLFQDTISGRYWMNRERIMRQIYPKGYEYDTSWILDAEAGLITHEHADAQN